MSKTSSKFDRSLFEDEGALAGPMLQLHGPEDTVEYHLFLDSISSSETDVNKCRAVLSAYKLACMEVIQTLSKDYLWHKDSFSLQVWDPVERKPKRKSKSSQQQDVIPACVHLFGQTTHGDGGQDEWFIVYLLVELTKRFRELTVRVTDADGSFVPCNCLHSHACLEDSPYVVALYLHPTDVGCVRARRSILVD
jgi:hypothetical protein